MFSNENDFRDFLDVGDSRQNQWHDEFNKFEQDSIKASNHGFDTIFGI
jgi:hypothetical protein